MRIFFLCWESGLIGSFKGMAVVGFYCHCMRITTFFCMLFFFLLFLGEGFLFIILAIGKVFDIGSD